MYFKILDFSYNEFVSVFIVPQTCMQHYLFCAACFFSQVLCVAVFFALLLKPVAVEESEEVEQVLLGKKKALCGLCATRTGLSKDVNIYCGVKKMNLK